MNIDALSDQLILAKIPIINFVITFYNDIDGKKSTRTIRNIKAGVTDEVLNKAADAISQLIEHARYEVKLVMS